MSHGASYCPHFKPTGERTLLPSGVKKDIVLEVVNLPTPQLGQVGFQCIVEVEGTKYLVPGRVEASRFVVCEKTLYSYQTPVGELEGEVAVVWNKNHYVDRVTVTLYKCDILGSHRDHPDCSLCVTRPDKYRCSWCDDACSYSESCRHNPAFECPRPRIDVIKPLDGPMEGGSLVMIEGSNLGLKEEDVRGKISIGNIPCELVDYAVSVRIICRTGPAWQEMEAPVIVGNNVGFTESPVKFRYKNIQLIGLHPAFGPQSGGTLITVRGSHLNIGTSLKVFLGDHPCLVQTNQISSSSLQCVTSRSNGPLAVQNVTVQLDDARRLLSGHPYFYVMDPTVMEIKPLRSFQSGGRNLNIHGKNLNSIQKPELVVYLEGQHEPLNKTLCKVRGESFMECPSPPVDRTFLLKKRERREDEVKDRMKHSARLSPGMGDGGVNVRVGFIMDHVEAVRDLAKNFKSLKSQLVYVEDPIFHRFPEKVKSYKGDTLVIEGENLNLACDESDVNVTIGTQPCNVTSLALTQLVCTPPEIQPIPTNEIGVRTGTNLPMVVVRVGVNLRYTIGFLRYDMMKPYNFPPEAVGGIAAGGFFLVVVSLVILLVYRHKSSEAEREYKRIQIQMDSLECNVRQECKQAFAELQTDMTDLTADLETSGIPYLSRRTFIMKVFFPGVSEHPVLNDQKQRLSGPQTTYDMAMLQFEQILHNKLFLLAFIDTLESQKTFTIRDKVNVASLLMIILLNKMEYASDVLRSLLLRLIDKSIHTKYPQLMLRRTESVVEKMLTNWMAVCMFNYLKEQSGISLFLLYKAIKHQIQKGPVDSVTNDARYSLSEDRLLKEQIDHHVVTIHLVQEDPHYEKIPYPVYQSLNQQQDELDEKLQCKVLDCDTVSQVKSKVLDALYKNTPFSLRPSLEEVDLEWRPGRGSHLILSDEDLTTKTINGWKRVNTLSHYGIKECAIMSLLPRQATRLAGPCKFAGHSTLPWRRKGEWESMSPTFSVSSLAHVFSNGYIENGNATNMYHLVRYVDENHYFGPKADRGAKPIPELFLTRLLSTKGTLQKFVDDFFRTILSASQNLAPTVKWLFDLLDEAARRHNITDFEVVHSWKSNSLPLRFWVNLIKNPDFIFDVNKTPTEDSCLSVIAQTFMDACATTHHRLGKDSPSNKLLFAKDIPHYKDMVTKFYTDVAAQPKINDNQLRITLNELSGQCVDEFDKISALKELYIYVHKYYDQLATSLQSDPYCRKLKLAHNLEDVAFTLDGEPFRRC